jgi:hypothetical protein
MMMRSTTARASLHRRTFSARRLALVLLPVLLAHAALAREFHVSVKGNDGNDGSASRPYRTPRPSPSALQPPHDQILYTEEVPAHWTETTVGEHGELVLESLPFEPGQPVEVLVVSKSAGPTKAGSRSLRDSVLEFREPLEPVASEEWDALQ